MKKNKVGEGYRELRDKEVIKPGDEIGWSKGYPDWGSVDECIGDKVWEIKKFHAEESGDPVIFRRRISKSNPEGWAVIYKTRRDARYFSKWGLQVGTVIKGPHKV